MGAAARKHAHAVVVPSRPPLRVVRGTRSRARGIARDRAIFRTVMVCLVVLAFAGVVRVTLAARAAEASIDACRLGEQLKAEQQVCRTLEADRSALAAPSRIEVLAAETLNMSRPAAVAHLELPSTTSAAVSEPPAPAASAGSTGRGVFATLVDLAADEAQVLLVGDMGLGSGR